MRHVARGGCFCVRAGFTRCSRPRASAFHACAGARGFVDVDARERGQGGRELFHDPGAEVFRRRGDGEDVVEELVIEAGDDGAHGLRQFGEIRHEAALVLGAGAEDLHHVGMAVDVAALMTRRQVGKGVRGLEGEAFGYGEFHG